MAADVRLNCDDPHPNNLASIMAAKYPEGVRAYQVNADLVGRWGSIHRSLRTIIEHGAWETATRSVLTEALSIETFVRSRIDLIEEAEQIFREAHDVNVAMLGIGSILADTSYGFSERIKRLGLSPDALRALGAVGQLNYHPFDEAGAPLEHEGLRKLSESIVAVPPSQFRALVDKARSDTVDKPFVIAVAGGIGKAKAIAACLRGGLFNVLITDEAVAHYLIDQAALGKL